MNPGSNRVLAGLCFALVAVLMRWLPGTETLAAARLASAGSAAQEPEPSGMLSTLFAIDPLQCSLDLTSGQAGMIVQEHDVRNRNSHISMGYCPDSLTVAIQGGDSGAIVDLGSVKEVGAANGTRMTGNGGNAYVALDAAFVREHDALRELQSSAHASIKLGHIYLVRIVSSPEPDLLAKLIVLEFQPGASVTIRWQLLD